jgi:hypothetical protein
MDEEGFKLKSITIDEFTSRINLDGESLWKIY